MAIPPRVNRGDPILAAAWNALVDAVREGQAFGAGAGIRKLGRVLGLEDGRPEPLYRGRIVGRDIAAPDGSDPDAGVYASAVRSYTVRPYGRGGIEAVIPPWRMVGRPNTRDTVAIHPAKIGHKCLLFRAPDVEGVIGMWMVVLTEEIKFVAKCKEPGGKPGNGIRDTANGGGVGGLGIPGGLGGFGGGGSFGGSLGGTSGGSGGSGGPSSSSGGA